VERVRKTRKEEMSVEVRIKRMWPGGPLRQVSSKAHNKWVKRDPAFKGDIDVYAAVTCAMSVWYQSQACTSQKGGLVTVESGFVATVEPRPRLNRPNLNV
jgi:hypothetical protein